MRFIILILIVSACSTAKDIAVNSTYVKHAEVYSEKGGRVDWNVTTNEIAMDQPFEDRWDIYICNEDKSIYENLTQDMTGKMYGDQMVMSWQHRGSTSLSSQW